MALQRLSFETKAEWLAGRLRGIGGSEAAAAVGLSPWQTPMQLWRIKIGAETPKDISDNTAVQQGVRMESPLRDMFRAIHPEFQIEYHPYDILYQKYRPFVFATLDGEITDTDGRKGILEIKTATPNGAAGWAKWADGNMPQNYYVQCCHQLLATGYDFVRLFAALYSMSGDITLREYEIERSEVEEDMKWLIAKETEFWDRCVRGELPPMPLIL